MHVSVFPNVGLDSKHHCACTSIAALKKKTVPFPFRHFASLNSLNKLVAVKHFEKRGHVSYKDYGRNSLLLLLHKMP